ncbi:hypothetical protein FGG08_000094 [Glutinoglossum americanum]|uniref:DUF8004 domain-containing protein n=1 Tax=Glutinoglossum americanum TaxID=1670608 RepID=A0A9P8IE57_9PEZI|nr:hypothetical protein FGG08_000094 [Glutinoglossum americanum]
MLDPQKSSLSASSSPRGGSPSSNRHKLSKSVQIPDAQQFLSPPDHPPASEPTEISVNRGRPSSRPPAPSFAKSPVDAGAATTDVPPTRRKWLPRSRNASEDLKNVHRSSAWLITREGYVDYDLSNLKSSGKVLELWDESGDTYVYLHPRTDGPNPSFKVSSSLLASSSSLTLLAHGGLYSNPYNRLSSEVVAQELFLEVPLALKTDPSDKESSEGSRTLSDSLDGPIRETHLYFPISLSTDGQIPSPQTVGSSLTADDVEALVSVRNLFAFLAHQPLVATPKHPTYFSIFVAVGDLLRKHQFSNFDGSSFGEAATSSFSQYIYELGLDDVRQSREKTIEGIVLGEILYSWKLYNESFVHAVGKYDSLMKLNHSKFDLISDVTRKRLERAAMDLEFRLNSVTPRLSVFEFPSLFAGIANSNSESKIVEFKAWKASFLSLRKHVIGFYKERYGSWPPKASSKKNQFEVSGLNRLVLRDLYQDFCNLYDFLVDRSQFTPRTTDHISHQDNSPDSEESRALRGILSEYDRSSPPVLPPVPFDVPRLPSSAISQTRLGTEDTKKAAKERTKKLKDEEMARVLYGSYNLDADNSSPFLESYKAFERKAAHGKTLHEACNQRSGYWIFIYAILQSLPMVVMDAPDIGWHEGVEYFLCVPPRGGAPWSRDDGSQRKSWYGIAGGTGVVILPSDVVDHGVEGVFRRSHCWTVAEAWVGQGSVIARAIAENLDDPLPPPPGLPGWNDAPRSRSGSPDRRSIVSLGLEALPVPAGLTPDSATPRSSPTLDPTKKFDDILGAGVGAPEKKKKKKRSEHGFGFLS